MSFSPTTVSQLQTFHMPLTTKNKTLLSQVMLYPVLKANELLLADPKRRHFLNKIQEHTGLEDSLYRTLYETTMVRFAELAQALPYQTGGLPGSLMDYSLEHAAIAIREYRKSAGADFSSLYAYALFTAGLFQHIGKIISQQTVMISDVQGKFIAEWLPLEGSLPSVKAYYYKFRYLDDQWIKLGKSAAPLLARQCMLRPGIEWIASDRKIFAMWMGMLTGDKDQAGDLLFRLELSTKLIDQLAKKDRLAEFEIESTRPPQTALGEEFITWLNEGLANGKILVNTPEAHVHVLAQGGLLIEPALFQQFCDKYGFSAGGMAVCKQFNHLGLTRLGGEGGLELEKFSPSGSVSATENIMRNPQGRGLFFNTGSVSIAAMAREGLIVMRPELFAINRAVGFSNLTSPSYVASVNDMAFVEEKVKNYEQTHADISKPFLERR